MNMSHQCHCCLPSPSHSTTSAVVENNNRQLLENSNQFDNFADGIMYDPNVFNYNIENTFGSFNTQDWPMYQQQQQPSYSYLSNDTVPNFEDLSTKTFLQPYDPSLVYQAASPSYMPSPPSSVDSDIIYDSLPLTPGFSAPQLFPATAHYPVNNNNCILPFYEENTYNNNNVQTTTTYEYKEQLVSSQQKKKPSRRRTTIQQLKCPVCVKVFSRPYNLKSHLRIHTNVRPYICEFEGCKWTFARPHDLKRHQMLHTGVKPFKCSCGKKFARSDAFKRHWKVDIACAAKREAEGALL